MVINEIMHAFWLGNPAVVFYFLISIFSLKKRRRDFRDTENHNGVDSV